VSLTEQIQSLPSGWRSVLERETEQSYFRALQEFVDEAYRDLAEGRAAQPAYSDIFRALRETDLSDVRVVILGQDPYPTLGHAMGVAFAVPRSVSPKPPSLQNIFKELCSDLQTSLEPQSFDSELRSWRRQGVLLLNTTLTVRQGAPLSHQGKGWEQFTDRVIEILGQRERPLVFLLWGNPARKKRILIKGDQHAVLESAHPSPLSAYRGFFGCRHFSKTNEILERDSRAPVDWLAFD
jgi:uracil-DNA glycosylase